jgi:hypothetical protein
MFSPFSGGRISIVKSVLPLAFFRWSITFIRKRVEVLGG